jgi:hypothetical protein
MLHVALEIPLGSLSLCGRGKCHNLGLTRIEVLRKPLDSRPFTRGITTLEQNYYTLAFKPHPLLKVNKFSLQSEKFLFIYCFWNFHRRII